MAYVRKPRNKKDIAPKPDILGSDPLGQSFVDLGAALLRECWQDDCFRDRRLKGDSVRDGFEFGQRKATRQLLEFQIGESGIATLGALAQPGNFMLCVREDEFEAAVLLRFDVEEGCLIDGRLASFTGNPDAAAPLLDSLCAWIEDEEDEAAPEPVPSSTAKPRRRRQR